MEPGNKFCWRCETEKSLDMFARASKDSVCKLCRYALNADWAKNNREKLRPKRAAYMKEYRARKNAEKKGPPPDSETPK